MINRPGGLRTLKVYLIAIHYTRHGKLMQPPEAGLFDTLLSPLFLRNPPQSTHLANLANSCAFFAYRGSFLDCACDNRER